jgi:hypothetical protein
LLETYRILSFILHSSLTPHVEKIIGILNVDCESVHQLFINFKKSYGSVRRDVLIEGCIFMKLVRIIKICVHETYSRDWVGKNLSGMFPIRSGLKQGEALTPFLLNFTLENAVRRLK